MNAGKAPGDADRGAKKAMTENRTPGFGAGRRPAQERHVLQDQPLGEQRRPQTSYSGRPEQGRGQGTPAAQNRRPMPNSRYDAGARPTSGERYAQSGRPAQGRQGAEERPVVRRAPQQGARPNAQPQRNPQGQRPAATGAYNRAAAPHAGERRPVQEMRVPRRPAPRAERIDPNQQHDQEYGFQAKQAERKRKRRLKQILLLVAVALVVLGGFSIKLALDLGGGANTFYEGVSVDGLKLNGYSKEEAAAKLQALNADRISSMTVHLSYSDREWTISPEQIGVALNIDEVLDKAWNLGREGNIFARQQEISRLKKEGEELKTALSYDEGQLRDRLNEVKSAVDMPAVEATITFDPAKEEKFKITQESNGRSVDLDTLFGQVKTQLDNSFSSVIEIKPDVVAPTVLADNLEKATKRIVRATTDLGSSSDARVHNVKTALSFFNGMVVQPGQEVSFNQTTGPRGLEQGYQNAGVIQDDEIIDGPGGGVCQVSTTLYQAVVKANLEIIRSNKHSLPVSYVPVGTDAAVAYDYKDLIFKNNTDYPIFIEAKVSGKTVAVSVYGYPLDEGTTVEIVTDVYETIKPAETKVILDTKGEFVTYTDETKVKKKARDGVKVKSFRVVKVNGEEVSRQLLRDDYYKEVQGETYQGVTPREAGATAPTTTNPPEET